jgi:hypothetical protein
VSGSSQRRFWSSSPSASTGSAKNPFEVIRFPIPAQPYESSSCTMQAVRQSVMLPPPSRSGSMNEVNPTSAARFQTSLGSSVSASSTASEIGRISFAAKSRQVRRISSCSGLISNGARGRRVSGGTVREDIRPEAG